jgi:excinuclease ABC subunit C
MTNVPTHLVDVLKNLPTVAGVYRYYDENDVILYVGKAKNLKNRVSSYFQKDLPNFKTYRLVKQIHRIEYTVVDSEFDALLLENNLIKQFSPKYNILLKDDKTYPYICVSNEPYPKIFSVRRIDKKMGQFFGPYSNVKAMYTVLELVHKLFLLRTCTLALTPKSIAQNKFKVCLEYHLKNCLAPCENHQSQKDYQANVEQAVHIIKGNLGQAKQFLREKMIEAAEKLAFEEAQYYKDKLKSLDDFQAKSLVSNPNISDVDVFSLEIHEEEVFYNYLHIVQGCIIQAYTQSVKLKLEETVEDVFGTILWEIRQTFNSQAKKILTNIELDVSWKEIEIVTPKIGDYKKLVDLSLKNVWYYRKEKLEKRTDNENKIANQQLLEQAQKDLRLKTLPRHIECFDNSNLQGTNAVSAMVCFKDGKPAKKEYRHYKVQTVVGANDFATMHEVITRRYTKLKEENLPLPDLIIVDGGKGQLSAAVQALKEIDLYGKIPIISIAKKLEELYYPNDELPLLLNKRSSTLKLIQHLRDEAHDFGINFHRQLRSKNSLQSSLEKIEGIGQNTLEKLLAKYKSIKNIKEADEQELATLIGKKRAAVLKKALIVESKEEDK